MVRKAAKIIVFPIFTLTVVVLIFSVIEGISSIFFVASEILENPPLAEKLHTQYDAEIGWVNIPNIYIKDMYGHGKYLQTNSQSFRNSENFEKNIPDGKTRIICSGDSFTLGFGVDNDHTWCQLLVSLNNNLEIVNMGQGGYGIDQMYLWYKRNGMKIDHNIHIFAFITGDFERMKTADFFGYGKPLLDLQDDTLITKNIPVPKRYSYAPWLNRNVKTIKKLSTIRIMKIFSKDIYPQNVKNFITKTETKNDQQVLDIALRAFKELYQISQEKNSRVVFVYLPTRKDYSENTSDPWRKSLHEKMKRNDLLFIDLINEFRELPLCEVEKLFIPLDVIPYVNAAGHYTEDGNAYIAKTLYQRLLTISEISNKLPSHK
jgi:hypothetical protein